MQSSHEVAITPQHVALVTPQCSNNEAILNMMNDSLSRYGQSDSSMGYTFQLKLQDLETLFRFQTRTVLAFGPQRLMSMYKTESMRLMALNPYCLHVAVTCTAMHDRYLAGQSHIKRTTLESYHWAMASQLFNRELSEKLATYDRDAVWMAAAFMSWIVLYAVETQNPEEVWSLSAASPDIPWFPIQKGLRTIWQMVEPGRVYSKFFKDVSTDPNERCLDMPSPGPGIAGIPQALVDMCELDESSNAENNPYQSAVRTLSTVLRNSSTQSNSLGFLAFINATEPKFEAMLRQRDPRSLCLMALWYGTVPKLAWWISLRASLERKAIRIYLDRYHPDDPLIQTVLASLRTT